MRVTELITTGIEADEEMRFIFRLDRAPEPLLARVIEMAINALAYSATIEEAKLTIRIDIGKAELMLNQLLAPDDIFFDGAERRAEALQSRRRALHDKAADLIG